GAHDVDMRQGIQRKPAHVTCRMITELVGNPAMRHFVQNDGKHEREGHDCDFLYGVQFIHILIGSSEGEAEIDTKGNLGVLSRENRAGLLSVAAVQHEFSVLHHDEVNFFDGLSEARKRSVTRYS